MMALLRFVPAGPASSPVRIPAGPASNLLVEIMKSGAYLRHDCGGRALCGTCRVEIDRTAGLSPMREAERLRLDALGLPLDGRIRLACQTHAFRDTDLRGCLEKKEEP